MQRDETFNGKNYRVVVDTETRLPPWQTLLVLFLRGPDDIVKVLEKTGHTETTDELMNEGLEVALRHSQQ